MKNRKERGKWKDSAEGETEAVRRENKITSGEIWEVLSGKNTCHTSTAV